MIKLESSSLNHGLPASNHALLTPPKSYPFSAEYIKLRNQIDAENFKKLSSGLSKSREVLLGGISGAFSTSVDRSLEERLTQLEEVLLQADIGASTSAIILDDLRRYAKTSELKAEDILPVLRERLIEALTPPENTGGINFSSIANEPTVIFVIGANGMGKTTTIGKLAHRLRNEANQTVLLGACDTFRAAAVEQLGEWATRANVSIVRPEAGETDPVPVVARTLRRGKEERYEKKAPIHFIYKSTHASMRRAIGSIDMNNITLCLILNYILKQTKASMSSLLIRPADCPTTSNSFSNYKT